EQIRKEIEASDSDWDREKLNERLAKLSGGVAVIKVGAATEVEMKERKHRIEDAISATKAAVEEGVIPGGGAALVQLAGSLADGPPTSRCAGSPRTPGWTGPSSSPRSGRRSSALASTRPRGSSSTSRRPASSTR